jgi:hypothetical protein
MASSMNGSRVGLAENRQYCQAAVEGMLGLAVGACLGGEAANPCSVMRIKPIADIWQLVNDEILRASQ